MPRLCSLAPLLLSCAVASAQYTAGKIVFSDHGIYTQQELEAAAGMHAGQAFANADLSTAAQRLSDTACFGTAEVTITGAVKSIAVVFKIKPVAQSQMVRASFQNIVWLTPDELTAAIHAKVPLFHGALPEAGDQIEAVTSALQQTLDAHSVPATVASSIIEPSTGHPDRIIAFAALKHPVVIGAVDLSGISPEMQPAMQKQIAALTGKPFSEGLAGATTAEALLAPYHQTGYISATIADFHRTPTEAADSTQVAVSGKVEEGPIYRVSSITFAGTSVFSASDFAAKAKLRPEEIASGKALRESFAPMEQAYKNQGFMDVVVDAAPTLDTATHHVAYTISVTPGNQYHLRNVRTVGLDPAAQADFDRGWTMKPGDIYNEGYVASFLKNNSALHALAPYTAGFKAKADPDTQLIDLTMTFVRGGSRP